MSNLKILQRSQESENKGRQISQLHNSIHIKKLPEKLQMDFRQTSINNNFYIYF